MSEKRSTPVATTRKVALATSTSILKGCGNLAILLIFLLAVVPNAHATAVTTTTSLKVGLTTAPASAITTASYGTSVTLTATVTGTGAAGTVTFYNNSVSLGAAVAVSSGSATLATTTLPVGQESLTAVFTPTNSGNFTASNNNSSPLTSFSVTKGSTTTGLAAKVNGTAVPSTGTAESSYVMLSASVTPSVGSGTPTGTVTFYNGYTSPSSPGTSLGSTSLIAGTASLTVQFPATPTSNAITAVYAGDGTYATSTSSAVTVKITAGTASTTVLTVSAGSVGSVVSASPLTLTATVTPSAASGSVVFTDTTTNTILGTATLNGSGVASLLRASFTNPLASGSNNIAASYEGSTTYQSSTSSPKSVTVTTPTVTTVGPLAGPYYYQSPTALTATVTPSAATGSVTFYDSGVSLGTATLSGGTASLSPVTFTSVGSHPITASYGGGGLYASSTTASSAAAVVGATTTAVALTPSVTLPIAPGASFTLTAQVTPIAGSAAVSSGSVTFYDNSTSTSVSLGKVSVSGSGAATLSAPTTLLPGKHYFIASYGGYFNKTGTAQFATSISPSTPVTISGAQTITFTGPASPVTYGASPVSLTASSTSVLTVTFTASGACSASGTTLTYTGAGTCTVTAAQKGNNSWNAATPVQQTVVVNPAPLTITASSPSAITYGSPVPAITAAYAGFVNGETKYKGLTTQPTCTTTYTTTSDPGPYTTSCSGAVGANYSISPVSGSFTVNKASQTFSHWYNSSTAYGTPVTLSATASSGLTVAYTVSSGPGSISNGTTLTPTGVGTIVVAANQAGNTDYMAATQVTVSVKVNLAPLVVTASSPSVTYGAAVPTITASYTGFVNSETSTSLTTQPRCGTAYTQASHVASAHPTTYCSAAVDPNYSITYQTGAVTISPAIPTVTWPTTSGSHTYGTTLSGITLSGGSAVQAGTSNNVPGTFAFTSPTTTPSVATTSASVTFTPTGANSTDYSAVTTLAANYVSFTVTKATPTITSSMPTPSAISYGVALYPASKLSGGTAHNPIVNATIVAGSFSWTTGSTVPSNIGSSNPENVTFTPGDLANYNPANANINVTVSKATPTVTVWPTASAINYGQALSASTLSTDGSANVAGTFNWTNPNTVPSQGSNISESVTFTPSVTTYYTNATGTVKITVNQLTATIKTLPTASAITYGQALSKSTLTGGSATVTGGSTPVAGRFTWTSQSTVPDVGGPDQSVTFTPTNTNYAPVTTGTVAVSVTPATPTVSVWPIASPIAFGLTLNSSNLSGATASVTGNFAWTDTSVQPAAGVSSNSVTFTPSLVNGDADYSNLIGWVNVVVNPCGLEDGTNSAYSTAMYVYNDSETPTPVLPTSSPIAIDVEGTNQSAICAVNAGPTDTTVTPTIVTYPFITSGAFSTYPADSNSNGTNAAVLAYGTAPTTGTGATITINDDGSGDPGSISTYNDNSNGVFASMGGTVIVSDTVISTSGNSAHALDATYGGTLTINGVQASTTGNNSAVIVAGVGGGTVSVDSGYYASSGSHSSGIRAAGSGSTATVSDSLASTTILAQNGPAVVVEGGNSVSITSTGGGISLSGALGDNHGIYLYYNPSRLDATAGTSIFTMTGGSIAYSCDAATVPACATGVTANDQNALATVFAVANTTATITLTDVSVINSTNSTSNAVLLTAAALNSGTPGGNGGVVTFTANGEILTGDVIVDGISTANLGLLADTSSVPSTLTGTINAANSGGAVSLTLDATSSWVVTGDSYLTGLTNAVTGNSNITCQTGGCHVYLNGVPLDGVN